MEDDLQSHLRDLNQRVEAFDSRLRDLEEQSAVLQACESLGLDSTQLPMLRVLPVRAWVGVSDLSAALPAYWALEKLMAAFGFSKYIEFAAESGS